MTCNHSAIQFLASTSGGVTVELCEDCGRFLVNRQSGAMVATIGELTANELAAALERLDELHTIVKLLAARKISGHLPHCPNTAGQCECGWAGLRKRLSAAAK